MINLVREYRAGKLTLFAAAQTRPAARVGAGRGRVRGRVIELRRDGLSTYEISARLGDEGHPAQPHGVGEIAEEGFGRLLRHPEPTRGAARPRAGRDARLPQARRAGLRQLARDHRDRQGRIAAAHTGSGRARPARPGETGPLPGTPVVPAASWLLSLLALKLTRTRRASHINDAAGRPRRIVVRWSGHPAEDAGLTDSPTAPATTTSAASWPPRREDRHAGLATAADAIFDLDFHAVMHWGHDPALERRCVPTRCNAPAPCSPSSPRTPAPPQPGLRQRRCRQIQPGPQDDHVLRPLESRVRQRPPHADHGSEGHHPRRARRTRHPRRHLPHPAHALARARQTHRR